MQMDPGRRKWLKRFALGSVASLSLPRWTGTLLAEVDETMPATAMLRLKVADYPNLASPGGSVQLQFNGISKPLTLNRVSPQDFVTLDSICTHRGCTVGPYILAEDCMRCPCHGSRYDLEGRVFRNGLGGSSEPAPDDLNRFATSYDEPADTVTITIPGLALAIAGVTAFPQSAEGTVRVALRFPVTAQSTYEIRHQPALDGAFEAVPFATSPGGGTQLSITPAQSGFITVYVDAEGPKGFYVVGLVLIPV